MITFDIQIVDNNVIISAMAIFTDIRVQIFALKSYVLRR